MSSLVPSTPLRTALSSEASAELSSPPESRLASDENAFARHVPSIPSAFPSSAPAWGASESSCRGSPARSACLSAHFISSSS
eukprot:1210037-Pleurochrysis_carterae.AAC.1